MMGTRGDSTLYMVVGLLIGARVDGHAGALGGIADRSHSRRRVVAT